MNQAGVRLSMKACTPSSAVGVHHVAGHRPAGVLVGGFDAAFELPVERAPCRARSPTRGLATMPPTSDSTSASSASGAATRLTRPLRARLLGRDEVAGDEHLEGRLARRGCATAATLGRRAEQAEVDAADGEAGVARRRRRGRRRRPAGSRPRWRCPARARSPAPAAAGSPASCARTARTAPRSRPATASARISFRSWPAQNALPVAAMTTTRARLVGGDARRARPAARRACPRSAR